MSNKGTNIYIQRLDGKLVEVSIWVNGKWLRNTGCLLCGSGSWMMHDNPACPARDMNRVVTTHIHRKRNLFPAKRNTPGAQYQATESYIAKIPMTEVTA